MPDVVLPEGLSFRVAEQSDLPFVYSSFIKATSSKGMLLDRHIPTRQAHEALRAICTSVLRKSACVILCDENHLDAIVGFVVFERQQRKVCVHFLYVKEHARGIGYSNLLWGFATRGLGKDDTVWVSTLSARARNIMDSKKIPYQFRPAMLFTDSINQSNTEDREHAHQKEGSSRSST